MALNKDIIQEGIGVSPSGSSISQSEINIKDYENSEKEERKKASAAPVGNKGKTKAKKKAPKVKNNSNHINLKYEPEDMDASGTDYKESTDEEILDDEYDNEGEDEETLDELLFLEAVASLNENISMLTINSTDIFNCFQNLVKETNTLNNSLKEFNDNLLKSSGKVENDISKEIKETPEGEGDKNIEQ